MIERVTKYLRNFSTQMPRVCVRTKALLRHHREKPFSSSEYWETRYSRGKNSGAGSYGQLARFKANVLNQFISDHNVQCVIEFGCGDGAQLELSNYPAYIGVDVSVNIVSMCKKKFSNDVTKQFIHTSEIEGEHQRAEIALSLDVIYHLIEDDVYFKYMETLTASATRFVGIYSSNYDAPGQEKHVRHRRFESWMEQHAPAWKKILYVPNIYPYDPTSPNDTSWADFHFYSHRGDEVVARSSSIPCLFDAPLKA